MNEYKMNENTTKENTRYQLKQNLRRFSYFSFLKMRQQFIRYKYM